MAAGARGANGGVLPGRFFGVNVEVAAGSQPVGGLERPKSAQALINSEGPSATPTIERLNLWLKATLA
jgi:hypothetical protein